MKKSLLLIVPFVLLFLNACATDADEGFDASSVCPAEGTNAYGMPNRGTFVDERDGRVYKYTTIGDQVWMAENLKYAADSTVCFDEKESNKEVNAQEEVKEIVQEVEKQAEQKSLTREDIIAIVKEAMNELTQEGVSKEQAKEIGKEAVQEIKEEVKEKKGNIQENLKSAAKNEFREILKGTYIKFKGDSEDDYLEGKVTNHLKQEIDKWKTKYKSVEVAKKYDNTKFNTTAAKIINNIQSETIPQFQDSLSLVDTISKMIVKKIKGTN